MTAVLGYLGLPSPQAFIAHTRKARDAWTASFLYADLMDHGLAVLAGAGADILQPHVRPGSAPPWRASYPNYGVARFSDLDTAEAALEHAAQAMRAHFVALANQVGAFLAGLQGNGDQWNRQVATFPEALWCAFGGEEGDEDLRRGARELWEARKRLRDQVGLEPEAGRPGCQLCGRREGLGGSGAPQELHDRFPRDVGEAEALCALCLIVRFAFASGFWDHGHDFGVPSLTAVAAAPWLERVTTQGQADLDGFEQLAKGLGWLDPGVKPVPAQRDNTAVRRWVTLLDALYGVDPPPDADLESLAILAEYRRDLLGRLDPGARRLPGRVALIAFDGDRLGAQFAQRDEQGRRELSTALAGFALEAVPAEVENSQHLGFLIYAGGDDGRLLAPASRALALLEALHASYGQAMGGATLSAGVALAEVSHPLELVVDAANAALEVAKEDYGRDALCVAWLTSGGTRLAGGPFRLGGNLVDAICQLGDAFAQHLLSASFPVSVAALAKDWEPTSPVAAAASAAFCDLVRLALVGAPQLPTPARRVVETWLSNLEPPRVAGLVHLARDMGRL